ncbi:MAG: flagellar hook-basal body complex protein [Pseudomonadota bacterium]
MSDSIYPTLGRQAGLLREMDVIAQNIANASTTGYRSSGVIFSEFVVDAGKGNPSVSMSFGNGRRTEMEQGGLEMTGGTLDLAIEGDGFFLVDVGGTTHLTRAGAFVAGADGQVQTVEGHPLLDQGEAPVVIPPGAAELYVAPDGTISADGQPVAQVGLVRPTDPVQLQRHAGTMFNANGAFEPVENPRIMQGALESSNVNPVIEIARMVTVQNAYELGQNFMEKEDERLRTMLRLMDNQ